jgi:hypothetical protein
VFRIIGEILANRIRKEKHIRGFEIKLSGSNHSIKISQLADDTTLFLKLKNGISIALNIIEIFFTTVIFPRIIKFLLFQY